MSHLNQALMISGIGQYHTNEADPENPNKKWLYMDSKVFLLN
jgi:hypothetical protein